MVALDEIFSANDASQAGEKVSYIIVRGET